MLADEGAAAVAEPAAPADAGAAEPAAAPAAAEPAAAPAPAAEPQGPRSKRDARSGLGDIARKAFEAVGGSEELIAEPKAGEGEAKSGAPAAGAPAAPAAPAAEAPKTFRVELPAEHPAARGKAVTYEFQTQEQADATRAMINGTYVRPRELSELDQSNQKLQSELITIKARQIAGEKLAKDPKYQAAMQRAAEIREQYGDEDADQYLAGLDRSLESLMKDEVSKMTSEAQTEREGRAAVRFMSEMWVDVNQINPAVTALPQFKGWFDAALESFESELQLGHQIAGVNVTNRDEMVTAFKLFFGDILKNQPSVVQAFSAAKAALEKGKDSVAMTAAELKARDDRLRKEAVEEFIKQQATRRAGQPPLSPLGKIAAAATSRIPGAPAPVASPPAAAGREEGTGTAGQVRRTNRANAAEIGRRFASPGT